jgi:hypothetical protein
MQIIYFAVIVASLPALNHLLDAGIDKVKSYTSHLSQEKRESAAGKDSGVDVQFRPSQEKIFVFPMERETSLREYK